MLKNKVIFNAEEVKEKCAKLISCLTKEQQIELIELLSYVEKTNEHKSKALKQNNLLESCLKFIEASNA